MEEVKKQEKAKKSEREKYIDKLSSQLKEWDRELEDIEQKTEKRFKEIQFAYRKRVDNLKEKRMRMKDKINKLKESGEVAFDPVKKDLEKLWKDAKTGLKTFRKEIKKE
jgi:hypothetical protein